MPPHSPRTIRLRRPATLSMSEGVFVPQGADLDEIERRWRGICDANPRAYDGRLCHVIGVHRNGYGGAVIHAIDCAYRFHAVQDDSFDLGVRPLGVKGITTHNERILLGRRAADVLHYPGMWEFAPGGGVEPGREPAQVIISELADETGLRAAREPVPVAVLFDPIARCWEIVFRIEAAGDALQPRTREYEELRWREPHDLPAVLSPIAEQMRGLIDTRLGS
jgi:ADP-ribose pyrophosphatase YjhB (NUDIX family)